MRPDLRSVVLHRFTLYAPFQKRKVASDTCDLCRMYVRVLALPYYTSETSCPTGSQVTSEVLGSCSSASSFFVRHRRPLVPSLSYSNSADCKLCHFPTKPNVRGTIYWSTPTTLSLRSLETKDGVRLRAEDCLLMMVTSGYWLLIVTRNAEH